MRVAVLTNHVPGYLIRFFEEFQALVDDLRIFVSVPPGDHARSQLEKLPVTSQRTLRFRGRSRHPRGFVESFEIHIPYDTLFRLVRYRPDVVVSNELGIRSFQAAMYAAVARKRLVLRVTVTEETERGRGGFRRIFRRVLMNRAHSVVVNGPGGARYVTSMGVSKDRLVTLPHTIDVDAFGELEVARSPKDRFRLLHVGQLIPRKGILEFLSAIEQWAASNPEREVRLTIAGGGELASSIEAWRAPPNVTMELLGQVEYTELPSLYGSCGVLVFPTMADSWGAVVNEAMASGLPVLGSIHSEAVAEMVVEGETGWLIRPEDPKDVMRALDRVFSRSPEEIEEMGRRAQAASRELTPVWGARRMLGAVDPAVAQNE